MKVGDTVIRIGNDFADINKVCYPELYLKATMHIKNLREDLPRFSYVDSYKLTYLNLLNLLNNYVENPDETTSINIWDN